MACHARDEVEDRWSTVADEVGEMAPPETNIERDQTDGGGGEGAEVFVPRGLGKLHGGDRIVVVGGSVAAGADVGGGEAAAGVDGAVYRGGDDVQAAVLDAARMPAFAGCGGDAKGLALEHGFAATVSGAGRQGAQADWRRSGRNWWARDGGFACVTCHSVVDTKAAARSRRRRRTSLHATTRLTHDYYVRWMRKPMRFSRGRRCRSSARMGSRR